MDIRSGFAINGVWIDLADEALRDVSGNPVVLRPQCFAVLRYLIEHANRLVTKDELMAAVWHGTAVTDDSLVQCIYQVRRALGDDGHAVLKTIQKRGYRLILPPETGTGSGTAALPASATSPRAGRQAAAVAVALIVASAAVGWLSSGHRTVILAAHGPSSIAVLPFDSPGEEAEQGAVAAGITEDLVTDLARMSGVEVIAGDPGRAYEGRLVPAKEAAAELGVRYLLRGSVRRDGDKVRISARLIDAAAGHPIWAERYDGTFGDGFALQDRVTSNIVSALAMQLARSEAVPAGAGETTSPEAHDALLLGLEHLRRDTEEDMLKAIAIFGRALELDRDYGRAHAAIAPAQFRIILSNWYPTAGAGLDDAYAGLRTNLAEAMERPSSLAYAVAALWALQEGRGEEGVALIDEAEALAPDDPAVLVDKALILNASGRAEEAEKELRLAMQLDPGFSPATLRALSAALFHQGKYQQAIDAVERLAAQGAATTSDYVTLTSSLGQLGRTDDARQAIDRYNDLAVPAAWDPMSVQEAQWHWNGDLFGYYRPYIDKLVEGLRKAGVSEGAGTDLRLDDYRALLKRGSDGQLQVEGAWEIPDLVAGGLFDRGVPFVDVRAHAGFASGHVPGAVNLSLVSDLSRDALMKVAHQGEEVVFYCHSRYCDYSAIAAAKAVLWGYTRVYLLVGGMQAWEEAACPIEVASAE